ncbi:MAG: 16S rRNA (guanine(527)-N(7))-methyltransferase RsmG [Burkholderiales bacterium]|nr:16S rRNA (guanine(527)-N(7))-methyltransferase RsmG [Burkholderiales bacterium]
MATFLDLLSNGLEELGIEPDKGKIQKLNAYADLLLKWNKVYNLTSIARKDDVAIRHILDSLSILKYLRQFCPVNGTVLDAGSGAGLPGIPLAIFCPDLQFTLVDAVRKKTAFQIQAVGTLGLTNVRPIHARLESSEIKGEFNVIVSRAFASLKDFTEITSHLTSNGSWLALKAKLSKTEIDELPQGFSIKEIVQLKVPFLSEERNLVIIQRTYPH